MGINMKKTGEKIYKLRKENRLPMSELSEYMGISPQAMYKWERGETIPNIDNIVNLSDFYKVKIEEIITIE